MGVYVSLTHIHGSVCPERSPVLSRTHRINVRVCADVLKCNDVMHPRSSAELFNNLGLCCFYAQQFDMALGCFERALTLAEDDAMADVWYVKMHTRSVCPRAMIGVKHCVAQNPRRATCSIFDETAAGYLLCM